MTAKLRLAMLLSILVAPLAHAGDVAEMRPHGFSQDGRYFAYEEFGEQDGSGFPYSTIYVVDTQTDTYLPGTPIEVLVRREDAPLGEARRESHAKAGPLFETHGIGDDPGHLVAYQPVSALSQTPERLRYRILPSLYLSEDVLEVAIEQFPLPVEGLCKQMEIDVQGFRLKIGDGKDPASARIAYEDKRVAKSRNCPSGYSIGGVVTPGLMSKGPHMVMVQMRTLGFEGNNLRWLAIPVRR